MYIISRTAESEILERLETSPVTAIIGPRQCGKSTLAKKILQSFPDTIYLDLELPSDLRKLTDAEQFFSLNKDSLICIDEIQRKKDLFPLLRALIDKTGRSGQFLILGSASPELLRQSSETLAGRISYFSLTPFRIDELEYQNIPSHWLRGGFPLSYLARDEKQSSRWRIDFISTFLEKDVPSLGFSLNTQTISRLWTMLAHSTGQVKNRAKLGESLGISGATVKSYYEILEKTFMVRILQPYHSSVKKRLIKSPKIYIRDTGILHSLLDIDSHNTLMGHPIFGQSWESYALEQIVSALPEWTPWFFRTSNGSEIDLLLTRGVEKVAVEFKASVAPKLGAGFFNCMELLNIQKSYVVCPFPESELYPYRGNVMVASLDKILEEIKNISL